MRELFGAADELLRGGLTPTGEPGAERIGAPLRKLARVGLTMGAIYGLFMGLYGALRADEASGAQLVASAVKVPALFFLTLLVTFPSLYVFSSLAGSRLRFVPTLKLLVAATAVNLALLASFGPVTGFFTLSTQSYPFMVVLNVLVFAVSGAVGLGFLHKLLDGVFATPGAQPPAQRRIFTVWTLLYCAVGAQMGWILRPFIGSPGMPFTLFRERESNFFEAFLAALGRLLV